MCAMLVTLNKGHYNPSVALVAGRTLIVSTTMAPWYPQPQSVVLEIISYSLISSQFHAQKFEKEYNQEKNVNTQFSYALCLIRSNYSGDMRRGIGLLQDLCEHHADGKRDYIYYLAFGYARLQEYTLSLKYIEKFLLIEPENEQAKNLQELVKSKRMSDATKGAAVVGG